MVLLVQKFDKFYSKLENFHHHKHNHQSQALTASLEAFKSHVSNCLNKLSSSSKSGLEIPSFSWIQQCFDLLPIINHAFAKLVVAIDYPVSKWEAASVDEYLKYSLNLLELCNSISSSLSHLGKARLSLAHALSLVENSSLSLALKHLKPIQPKVLNKELRFQGNEEIGKPRCSNISKQAVIDQALVVMQGMVFWVCGILMSGLVGEAKPYLEMRSSGGRFVDSWLPGLDLRASEVIVERNGVLKEVKELDDAVAGLAAAIGTGKSSDEAAEELRRRLEVFEKLVEGFGKEVDCLFNKVLAGRNQLLNGLGQQKQ
ncbi:unnamed protein product [Prunus armeniaca]|uniref:Uncharacterized protein n=1 Tax=Prunus armeniaca TaxID=36596 RepID=A0A6J5WLJ8_PRUAR|nr:unnamed protein product [Prunus armeniaca]